MLWFQDDTRVEEDEILLDRFTHNQSVSPSAASVSTADFVALRLRRSAWRAVVKAYRWMVGFELESMN